MTAVDSDPTPVAGEPKLDLVDLREQLGVVATDVGDVRQAFLEALFHFDYWCTYGRTEHPDDSSHHLDQMLWYIRNGTQQADQCRDLVVHLVGVVLRALEAEGLQARPRTHRGVFEIPG